jgi:ubiquinone/menaquinone biosynthesis C-methylase UbiE
MSQQTHAAETYADVYESILVPAIYEAWATITVDNAKPRNGDRALDAACGTGVVSRLLSQRLGAPGEVIGLDCDPLMIAAARAASRGKTVAPIEYDQGSATSIPYEDEIFEIVTCQQGLPYFSDRAAAIREMYRVMIPGGRLAMLVWRGIEYSPAFRILAAVLDHYLGAEATAYIRSSFVFEEAADLRTLLVQSRFRNAQIEEVDSTAHFASVDEFFRSQVIGTQLVDQLATLDAPQRAELFTVLANALKSYVTGEGLSFPMGAFLITAKK